MPWDVSSEDLKQSFEPANLLPLDQVQSQAARELLAIVPSSSRARAPANQEFSDIYIDSPEDRSRPTVESAMPLYLSEELSPRFSRAKQTRGWNERRLREQAERVEIGRVAVEEWEAGGRDRALNELLADDSTGLEGVKIRSRTRQEVRDAAMAEYDEELAKRHKMVQHARKMGLKWDRHVEGWEAMPEPSVMPGGQQDKAATKRDRKDRRADRLEQKLEDLKLEEGRNMVLPPDLRQ
jgi:large subunit ribosomal protein L24